MLAEPDLGQDFVLGFWGFWWIVLYQNGTPSVVQGCRIDCLPGHATVRQLVDPRYYVAGEPDPSAGN